MMLPENLKTPYYPNYRATKIKDENGVTSIELSTKVRKFDKEKKVWYEKVVTKKTIYSNLDSEIDNFDIIDSIIQSFLKEAYKVQLFSSYHKKISEITQLQCSEEYRMILDDPILMENYLNR